MPGIGHRHNTGVKVIGTKEERLGEIRDNLIGPKLVLNLDWS